MKSREGRRSVNLAKKALSKMTRSAKSDGPTPEALDPRDSRTDAVHVYSTLWSLFDDFGGMTSAVIRRSNSFLNRGEAKSATILTFAANNDADEVTERLRAMNVADTRLEIRNLWSDLRTWSDDQLASLDGEKTESPVEPLDGVKHQVSPHFSEYLDDSENVVGKEHYRDDGSLLVSDRKIDGSREVVAYSSTGEPLVRWDRARMLYKQWVTSVISSSPSVLIVDAGPVSVFAHEICPRDFKLVHYLHVSHLKRPDAGIYGELISNRVEALRDLEQYDLVAAQTKQQVDDLAKLGLSKKRLRLIPSELSEAAFATEPGRARDEAQGIVVARLVELKQVDHAIQAVATARQRNSNITLDICGDGDERQALEELTRSLNLTHTVAFHGHVNDVSDRLAAASFSLLTSKFEGLGLAILESMAAGCIPIVYDITYGPRDIITHGVNGYIVPYGDTAALASQINEFLNLDVETKNQMRAAAADRAKDFLSENIYPKWKSALEAPVKVHNPKPFLDDKYLRIRDITIGPTGNGVRLSIVFADKEEVTNKNLRLIVAGRKKNTFFQTISSPDGWQRTDGRTAYNFTLSKELFSQSAGQTFDVYIRKVGARWDSKVRLKLPATFTKSDDGTLRWFRTEYGNLSVKCLAAAKD